MRIHVAAFVLSLALFHSASGQVPVSEALQVFSTAGGRCAELAGELRKRETELELQASKLEAESGSLKEGSEVSESPEGGQDSKEEEPADPELQEVETELARLKQLAEANQGDPVYRNLMESIAHLTVQRQQLGGSGTDEQVRRQNNAANVANRRIADVNERIAAYNALSMKFEEDYSRFRTSCTAR